jgi:Calcineurin-like phosphoesterase
MAASAVPRPEEILALDRVGADRLLDELERHVPTHPPLVRLTPGGAAEAIVFGDTHGDWRSTLEVAAGLTAGSPPRLLIGLGDYVDRFPPDCPNGSVGNALHLLALAARDPDRVFLLQGNHETTRRVPVVPHSLPHEVDELWGPDRDRTNRIVSLLERGPLALTTPNGAYLAHAGFPRGLSAGPWERAFDRLDEDALCEIVWAECDASHNRRGAARSWGARDLDRFLGTTGLKLVLRGHDPDVCGVPLYGGRSLTLQTTRVYERYGGVISALLPLRMPLESVSSLTVHHLRTEGQRYPSVRRGGSSPSGHTAPTP